MLSSISPAELVLRIMWWAKCHQLVMSEVSPTKSLWNVIIHALLCFHTHTTDSCCLHVNEDVGKGRVCAPTSLCCCSTEECRVCSTDQTSPLGLGRAQWGHSYRGPQNTPVPIPPPHWPLGNGQHRTAHADHPGHPHGNAPLVKEQCKDWSPQKLIYAHDMHHGGREVVLREAIATDWRTFYMQLTRPTWLKRPAIMILWYALAHVSQ